MLTRKYMNALLHNKWKPNSVVMENSVVHSKYLKEWFDATYPAFRGTESQQELVRFYTWVAEATTVVLTNMRTV
jgi:hypothetical protein